MRSGRNLVVDLREDKEISDFPILGPQGSGKTTLIRCLNKENFNSEYEPTIGMSFTRVELINSNHKFHLWDTPGNLKYGSLKEEYYSGAECPIFVISSEVDEGQVQARKDWLKTIKDKIPLLLYILVINKKTEKVPDNFFTTLQAEFKDIAGIDIDQNNHFVCDPKNKADEGLEQLKAKLVELASSQNKVELEQKAQGMFELISSFQVEVKEAWQLPSSFTLEHQSAVDAVIKDLAILNTAKLPEAFQAVSNDWNKLAKLDHNLSALKRYVQSSPKQAAVCEKLEEALGEVILEKLQHLKTNFENYRQHLQAVAEKAKVKPDAWCSHQVESKINDDQTPLPLHIKEALQKWIFVNRCCQILEEKGSKHKTTAMRVNALVNYLKSRLLNPDQTILDFIEERRSGFIKSFLAAIRRFFGLKPEEIKAARHGFFETKIAPVDGAKLMQNVRSLLPKALK